MLLKKRIYLLLIVMILGSVNAGCRIGEAVNIISPTPFITATRSPTPEPSATPEIIEGTISIWHPFEENQRNILFRQIAAFQKQYPFILFDVQYVPMLDLLPAFQTAIESGRGPTILIAPAEWGPALFDQDFVLDLSSLADKTLLNSLNPPAVQSGNYRGTLISLPLDIKGVVLYRNQTIIPVSPATFEDMLSLVNNATRGEVVGAFLERGFFYSGGHLYGLGGELIGENGEPLFDADNFYYSNAWLDLLKAFERLGPTQYNNDQDINLFKESRVGLIIDGTWNMQSLADAIGQNNLAIDPWPRYQDGHLSGFVQSENIYLTSRAKDEANQISWMFIKSMYTEEVQLSMADVGLIPAGSGALEFHLSDKVNVNHPLIAQAMIAMVDGAPYPILPEFGAYNIPMDIALQSALYKKVDNQKALQTAYDSIQTTLSNLHPPPQLTPTNQP